MLSIHHWRNFWKKSPADGVLSRLCELTLVRVEKDGGDTRRMEMTEGDDTRRMVSLHNDHDRGLEGGNVTIDV